MKYPLFRLLPLLPALWVGVAAADGPWQGYREIPLLLARGYSLDQAVAKVRKHHAGKVLSAETIHLDDRPVHRVRIIEDGRVQNLFFDGNSGRLLPRAQRKPGRGPGR